ncbi:MAG: F0F1 ATP synthase subunit A [bacterium]
MFAFAGLFFALTGGGDGDGTGGGHDKLGADFIMHHITDHPLVGIHLFGMDFSITKHILMMWIASAILIITFSLLFRKPKLIPSGLANLFESIIVFLQDEVMRPYLGKDSYKYAPYLLTAFFFILLCNLMGLVPGAATATGNISVTVALALLTFVMVQAAGIKNSGLIGYFRGLIPPGLPWIILPIMIPVELVGLLTKHFALAIRLFANMVAGHVVIFALLLIIFTFENWFVGGITLGGIIFVSLLEILIGFIQAFIFTILSSVFIGMAVHPDH